jgi:tetratricopeptide (TPR) repeat protein
MPKLPLPKILFGISILAALGIGSYWLPPVHQRLSWRLDFAMTYLRGVIQPVEKMPTALPQPRISTTRLPKATPTDDPQAAPTPGATPTPEPSPTPIPQSVTLPPPAWEKQTINNCGPATLTMYLRFYGWEGNQQDIDNLIKPKPEDRNVNVEELVSYVHTQVPALHIEYRVGGDEPLLKKLLAAGIPVMVEESFFFTETYWPNDDKWAAHYNLLTGYDDSQGTFTSQDSNYGPDQKVPYQTLDEWWQSFNRVYILVYPEEKAETVKSILGADWDVDANRQHALDSAKAETEAHPDNAFGWFNMGTNLVYFERYDEAAQAYDRARQIGLPQRMLRYQFGPFFAYFNARRIDDLLALTDYALKRTPTSEEAMLWRGWALYRNGDTPGAIEQFKAALDANWNYGDAKYALNFVQENPRGK